jgi:hypothetical protein
MSTVIPNGCEGVSILHAVMAGRFYTKAFLDKALARHRERFERPAHEKFTLAFIRLSLKLMNSTR